MTNRRGEFGCPEYLEKYRKKLFGQLGDSSNGCLDIRPRGMHVIFSSGGGWEHISAKRRNRTPSYADLDRLKREFWPPDAVVMQLHVSASDHINDHDHVLHLWRPIDGEIPLPPLIFV